MSLGYRLPYHRVKFLLWHLQHLIYDEFNISKTFLGTLNKSSDKYYVHNLYFLMENEVQHHIKGMLNLIMIGISNTVTVTH